MEPGGLYTVIGAHFLPPPKCDLGHLTPWGGTFPDSKGTPVPQASPFLALSMDARSRVLNRIEKSPRPDVARAYKAHLVRGRKDDDAAGSVVLVVCVILLFRGVDN